MANRNGKRATTRCWLVAASMALALLVTADAGSAGPLGADLDVVFADDFESGVLARWSVTEASRVEPAAGSGAAGGTALAVALGPERAYASNTDTARIANGYLTFRFDPNDAAIPHAEGAWVPGQSVVVASLRGVDPWCDLVALYVRRAADGRFLAFLGWHAPGAASWDHVEGEFALSDAWQEITIGFEANAWIGAWVDGAQARLLTGIEHAHVAAQTVVLGQFNAPGGTTPSGTMRFDDARLQVPHRDHVWVSRSDGNDASDGATASSAVRTIGRGLALASPGTIVHVLPGTYRESLRPATSGHPDAPVVLRAEEGPGTAVVRGSISAAEIAWMPLRDNAIGLPGGVDPGRVFVADLGDHGVTATPRFLVRLGRTGEIGERLPLAREPDWRVATEWKHHEYWWAATGGSEPTPFEPPFAWNQTAEIEAERRNRSEWYLTDHRPDAEPVDIEPGDLRTLPDLVGATIWVMDTGQGHNTYRRTIVEHDRTSGRVKVDEPAVTLWHAGLGWGSKYYVENLPSLLDEPGEWWFDEASGRLYVWPPDGGDPGSSGLEISWLDHGVDASNRSHVTIDGLAFELFEGDVVRISNGPAHRSSGVTVRNARARYANRGVYLHQDATGPEESVIAGFTLEGSEIGHMDTVGIQSGYWFGEGGPVDDWTHAGVRGTRIARSELHHLAFRSDSSFPVGNAFLYADTLRFEGNHVHHTAHCGVNFFGAIDSVVDDIADGFAPEQIRTGDILIHDNVFEKACQLNADCGALKVGGSPPYKHVFRDFLVMDNVFRDTFGWTYASVRRRARFAGDESPRTGLGGFGFYVDYASGIHAYRNVAYNNAHIGYSLYGYWRNGDVLYYDNIAANSVYGVHMSQHTNESETLDVPAINTQLKNNILVNSEVDGVYLADKHGTFENVALDHNLYFGNGWRTEGGGSFPGDMVISIEDQPWSETASFRGVEAIREATPWEEHGLSADPGFRSYDWDDHDWDDGSWPDFRLRADSVWRTHPKAPLPGSMTRLIRAFGAGEPRVPVLWMPLAAR